MPPVTEVVQVKRQLLTTATMGLIAAVAIGGTLVASTRVQGAVKIHRSDGGLDRAKEGWSGHGPVTLCRKTALMN